MPRWDIDPEGVRRVVTKTAGVAEGLVDQADAYIKSLQAAAEASGSALVAKALVDFATAKDPFVQDLVTRTTRVMTAAVGATKAYVEGDTEMAEAAQAEVAPLRTTLRGPR
jgi:hypothetical protein